MQAPSNQSLCLESDFHQWEFSELAHSELKLFFFLHNIFGTSDDCLLVYLRLEELPNMKKDISKTRLEETSERLWNTFKVVNFISQTSIVKRVQNMIRLEMDPGRIWNNMSPSTLFPVNEVSTLQSYCLFFVLFLFPFERQCFCVESNKDWAAHQQTQTTVLGRQHITSGTKVTP